MFQAICSLLCKCVSVPATRDEHVALPEESTPLLLLLPYDVVEYMREHKFIRIKDVVCLSRTCKDMNGLLRDMPFYWVNKVAKGSYDKAIFQLQTGWKYDGHTDKRAKEFFARCMHPGNTAELRELPKAIEFACLIGYEETVRELIAYAQHFGDSVSSAKAQTFINMALGIESMRAMRARIARQIIEAYPEAFEGTDYLGRIDSYDKGEYNHSRTMNSRIHETRIN